jgi:hypothetical protein
VLAGFIAGFFSVAHIGDTGYGTTSNQVAVAAPAASAQALAGRAEQRLAAAGVTAHVVADRDSELVWSDGETVGVVADVSGGPAAVDTAITALTGLVPGQPPVTETDLTAENDQVIDGVRQMSIGVLALGFVIATASAGLTAAATVLDRRRVYGLLRLAGTPLRVLDRARTRETLIPLVVLAGGTTAAGMYAATRLNALYGTSADGGTATLLGVCLALGVTAMYAAITLSKPLLRRVTESAVREPD